MIEMFYVSIVTKIETRLMGRLLKHGRATNVYDYKNRSILYLQSTYGRVMSHHNFKSRFLNRRFSFDLVRFNRGQAKGRSHQKFFAPWKALHLPRDNRLLRQPFARSRRRPKLWRVGIARHGNEDFDVVRCWPPFKLASRFYHNFHSRMGMLFNVTFNPNERLDLCL